MPFRMDERKAELLDRLGERLHEKLPEKEAALAESFLRLYYRGVSPEDLAERDLLDLYGIVLAHLRFAQDRAAGEARVRVYNPQLEQHGWDSSHTVVEISTDDMPFLVDSVTMEVNRHGFINHLVIHPVIAVRRSRSGRILEVRDATEAADGDRLESFMHCEISRQSEPEVLERLEQGLLRVLGDVRVAVEDWQAMTARIDDALRDLQPAARHMDPADFQEIGEFLRWIRDHHFTFLGYARYELFENEDGEQVRRGPEDSFGILRLGGANEPYSKGFAELSREIRRRAREPLPALMITKANTRSTVHRPSYLDYIGLKRYDRDGKVIGEHRFLGLFTAAAYNRSPRDMPLLRRKVARIVERAGLPPKSHDAKALINILETYPRDELFQTAEEDLAAITQQILQLQERQRIRLFLRSDSFARFVSCLVFVPRERYNTALRERIQAILLEALDGTEVDFRAQVSESVLARVLFIVRTPTGRIPDVDIAALERRLVEAVRSWGDGLREALVEALGEEEGNRLCNAFGGAFPTAYQEDVPPRMAVADVLRLDSLARGADRLAMSLYRLLEDPEGLLRFKLMRADEPIHLSAALPVLENLGLRVLDERPYALRDASGRVHHLHDFGMLPTPELVLEPEDIRAAFQETFARVWDEEAENDGFNRLVLHAGLSCDDVIVLRAYCKCLLQVGSPFSQAYIEQTLAGNPGLARMLAQLFAARFDPDQGEGREARVRELESRIEAGLDQVENLDEDRILRRFLGVLRATLRTNAYQRVDGRPKPHLSLKFDPALVPDMPLPRPAYEIFVYAVRAEGVHLRGGKVARGGLRWSDRREDFRTEVLGLMKAQMVKNAVIVPVGAKGGFIVKRPPRDRQAYREEGVACYKVFLHGMLDITDNRVGDAVVPPERVVRYDDDDPYLVVAADKGTATFSDIANEVSREYGFWLDDAFASGGSAGYDHKKMGITAKGGWESVRHHFRALGRDCQEEPFTCVGIGDMSGDVFGNGMLLSRKTRLIAAFNHLHIFLDPDPDPEVSFEERRRLFELPRSSWDDYDKAKISKGGGVFPRTAKSIKLSPEACAALDVEAAELNPFELIRAILRAPVDLLWNGGIGTYVKAAAESHGDAQDRANDPVRVDAEELRCKVIGEGGNLGLTQKGRIAFALRGGRINTDFIDNSAGVDCSDHEVNIKILLGQVVAAGDMTRKQRDELLARMTDEVALLCLRDNVLQNFAISVAEAFGEDLLDPQLTMMRRLEAAGRLSRELEELPSDDELAERRASGHGLSRPELAVLLAYGKMTLYQDLLESDLPDDPYFNGDLLRYFPSPLEKRFARQIAGHRLRRELVATTVANSIINRGLDSFVAELQEETGCAADEIARAYVVARDAFDLRRFWAEIEAFGREIPARRQMQLLGQVRGVLLRGSQWFLRNLPPPIAIEATVARFRPGIAALIEQLETTLAPMALEHFQGVVREHVEAGLDPALARDLAALPYLLPASEVVFVADAVGIDIAEAGRVYFALDAALRLDELRRTFARAKLTHRWDRLALSGLQDDLFRQQRVLAIDVLQNGILAKVGTLGDGAALAAWLERDMRGLERCRRLLGEVEATPSPDVAMLTVAVRSLGQISVGGRPSG